MGERKRGCAEILHPLWVWETWRSEQCPNQRSFLPFSFPHSQVSSLWCSSLGPPLFIQREHGSSSGSSASGGTLKFEHSQNGALNYRPQCVKARDVQKCIMYMLEQLSFPCCLEMSPQKGGKWLLPPVSPPEFFVLFLWSFHIPPLCSPFLSQQQYDRLHPVITQPKSCGLLNPRLFATEHLREKGS